ncbi:MAG: HEPN domain-containing protein [Candidatus Caldarchaeales archaeon]
MQALADLKAAHDLLNSSNYAWACFAGHQAAEKALKAILEHFGTPSTGHNLLDPPQTPSKIAGSSYNHFHAA